MGPVPPTRGPLMGVVDSYNCGASEMKAGQPGGKTDPSSDSIPSDRQVRS